VEKRVREFLTNVANSLVKLEIVLFFTRNPSTIDSCEGIAQRLYRDVTQVAPALNELAEKGVLDCFELGSGSYLLFSLKEDPEVRGLCEDLSSYYHNDAVVRVEIIRTIMSHSHDENGSLRTE